MKNLIVLFLMVCAFHSYSQTEVSREIIPTDLLGEIFVECDGTIDHLIPSEAFEYEYHIVEHFDMKMDNILGIKWSKNQGHNTYVSAITGELFETHEINSGDLTKGIWRGKLLFKGNKGSKYYVTMILEWTDPLAWPTLLELDVKCH
ncbi:hypothetical protein [Maribellus mangrovi]|uniref:hypothetical protein n=1 Tax=Maribellus mangrovi TaxID=3133146 RepID=UPI0030ED1311